MGSRRVAGGGMSDLFESSSLLAQVTLCSDATEHSGDWWRLCAVAARGRGAGEGNL